MISTTSLSHKIITDITLTRHQLKPPNLIIPIMKKKENLWNLLCGGLIESTIVITLDLTCFCWRAIHEILWSLKICGPNSQLIIILVKYEFIFQAHKSVKIWLLFYQTPLFTNLFMNTFFYLDSTCLLNKPKIKGQA